MPQPRKHASHAARQAAYRNQCAQTHQQELAGKGFLVPDKPIPPVPGKRRWRLILGLATKLVAMVHDEMQRYYGDRSQSWQEGDRGDAFQSDMDEVETAVDTLSALLP